MRFRRKQKQLTAEEPTPTVNDQVSSDEIKPDGGKEKHLPKRLLKFVLKRVFSVLVSMCWVYNFLFTLLHMLPYRPVTVLGRRQRASRKGVAQKPTEPEPTPEPTPESEEESDTESTEESPVEPADVVIPAPAPVHVSTLTDPIPASHRPTPVVLPPVPVTAPEVVPDVFAPVVAHMLEDSVFPDVQLVFHGTELPAHRAILALRCPALANLDTPTADISALVPASAAAHMEAVLQFIYTDETPTFPNTKAECDALEELARALELPFADALAAHSAALYSLSSIALCQQLWRNQLTFRTQIAKIRKAMARRRTIRTHSAKEILTTERTYATGLGYLVGTVVPLWKDRSSGFPDALRDVDALLMGVGSIKMASDMLLARLEESLADFDVDSSPIGKLFVDLASFFKMYAGYAAAYDKTQAAINSPAARSSNKFQRFLKEVQSNPNANGLDLMSYIVLPVQRIMRYPMLIQAVSERTLYHHPDHDALQQAEKLLSDVAKLVDKDKGLADTENVSNAKTQNYFSHLSCQAKDDLMGAVFQPHRMFRAEYLHVTEYKLIGGDKTRHLVLFSDLLMISRTKGRQNLALKHTLPLCVTFLDQSDLPNGRLTVYTPAQCFVFGGEAVSDMSRDIEAAIDDMVKLQAGLSSARTELMEAIGHGGGMPAYRSPKEIISVTYDKPGRRRTDDIESVVLSTPIGGKEAPLPKVNAKGGLLVYFDNTNWAQTVRDVTEHLGKAL